MSDIVFLLLTIGTFAALNGILVLGLNVQFGTAGIFNLAYIAVVAVGAYGTGIAELPAAPPRVGEIQYVGGFGWGFWPAVLFGVAMAVVFTLVLGSLAFLRLREDYLGLTLFAVQAGLLLIATNYLPLLDGARGLVNMQGPFQDQLSLNDYEWVMFGLSFAALVGVYIAVRAIDVSPLGRTLRALREDERAVASLGRNPWALKVTAFLVGGAIAGLGGALFATYTGGWSPGAWQPLETLLLFSAIFVGGRGSPLGVLIGSVVVLELIGQISLFLPTIADRPDLLPQIQNILAIVILLAFLWWRPNGLWPERKERFSRPDTTMQQAPLGSARRATSIH